MKRLMGFLPLGLGITKSKTLTPNFFAPRNVRPSLAPDAMPEPLDAEEQPAPSGTTEGTGRAEGGQAAPSPSDVYGRRSEPST